MIVHRVGTFLIFHKSSPKTVERRRVGIFKNMIHKTTILYYCWKPEIQKYSTIDSRGNAPLYWVIGQTLTDLFTENNDCTQGLQHARLKIGCSTIVAFKRINDIKVTIDTITNN